jgi:hypothetical protein
MSLVIRKGTDGSVQEILEKMNQILERLRAQRFREGTENEDLSHIEGKTSRNSKAYHTNRLQVQSTF